MPFSPVLSSFYLQTYYYRSSLSANSHVFTRRSQLSVIAQVIMSWSDNIFFLQVILALRAIGNAGHMSRGIHLINMCMSRNRNPIEVRVAATEAYRRMPCDDNVSIG